MILFPVIVLFFLCMMPLQGRDVYPTYVTWSFFSWTGSSRLLTILTVRCSKTSQRCFLSRRAEEVSLFVVISTSLFCVDVVLYVHCGFKIPHHSCWPNLKRIL